MGRFITEEAYDEFQALKEENYKLTEVLSYIERNYLLTTHDDPALCVAIRSMLIEAVGGWEKLRVHPAYLAVAKRENSAYENVEASKADEGDGNQDPGSAVT